MAERASLDKLKTKKIAFLGLGIENNALIKFLLAKKIKAEFTVCDFRSKERLAEKYKKLNSAVKTRATASLHWQLGKNFNKNLDKFDVLFRSPGWPLDCSGIKQAIKVRGKEIEVSSPIKLFLKICPTKNIIGVTGTKGKGTTAALIFQILKAGGKKVWLGGNIGVAPFAFITKIKSNHWVVLELSSFQLEDLTVSPPIAVTTNFYREHLAAADPNNPNFHQNLGDYWRAKINIFKWQGRGGLLVANRKLALRIKSEKLRSKTVFFAKAAWPTKLVGEHNRENIAAAGTVARFLKIKDGIIARAVYRFKGLEHRLELVKEVGNVKYYNDSFATTPPAAITAIKSFKRPIVLLAGGAEKGSDFKALARLIKKRVKYVILLAGKATPRLATELKRAGYPAAQLKLVNNIRSAVVLAARKADDKGIVLLSPACASFGMFKNYKERGALFKKEVNRLT